MEGARRNNDNGTDFIIQNIRETRDFYINRVNNGETIEQKMLFFKRLEDTILKIPDVHSIIQNEKQIYYLIHLFKILEGRRLSDNELVKSMTYNFCFDYQKFTINLPEGFHLQTKNKYAHVESPNQMSINDQDKNSKDRKICTFNFFFIVKDNGLIELRINNIQGAITSKEDMYDRPKGVNKPIIYTPRQKRKVIYAIFDKLNQGLKEDRKSYIVKAIIENADNQHTVIGELPPYYSWISSSFGGYMRYLLNYFDAYLQGGLGLESIDAQQIQPQLRHVIQPFIEKLSHYSLEEQVARINLIKKKYHIRIKELDTKINIQDESGDLTNQTIKEIHTLLSFDTKKNP